MASCRETAKKHLPKDAAITHVDEWTKCLVDFKESSLRDEVSDIVDCESRCSDQQSDIDWQQEEYDECKNDCEDNVERSVTGSIHFDEKTTALKESTFPLSCSRLSGDDLLMLGELSVDVEGTEAIKLKRKLKKVGCTNMDYGWMHPHEFAKQSEWEEDPAICYLHVKASGEGKCKLSDVSRILWGKKR